MRDDKLINAPERKITDGWRNRWASSIILTITFIVALAAMLSIFTGNEQNYTPVTITCISCHNDTGYPNDTSLDGRFAPYERPHNNTVWCEYCHLKNPHTIVFIQPNGSYSARSTAASCPECHQAGVPNPNFTSAPRITSPLRHSSNILNGSVWGNYWMNTEPKTACMYCHGNTLHNTTPFGRILAWSPDYQKYRPIGANFTCADCHYKGDANWSQMNLTFTSAGLKIPPEITNGTTWKGFPGYFNHTLDNYTDGSCRQCHGLLLSTNASMSEFIHNVDAGSLEACTSCHSAVSSPDLGMHSTLNGTSGVDNGDCKTCHYGTIQMVKGGANTSNTYYCADCHTSGGTGPKKSNITFTDKIHGEATCTDCHVADGTYHQDSPRGAVANSTYVSRYTPGNTTVVDCADCHYARNLDDAPFNAPGGGNHIINNGGACADGGCHHLGGSSMVETVHSLNPQDWGFKPSITVPSLSASTVMKGTNVTVNATITAGGDYDSVDGAHYRIMSGAVEIVPWTPMSAEDGDFGGTSDVATATINTSALGGAYTVEVRGMAGGPSQNPAMRYYPVNGDVSAVQSATLNVTLPLGYINGIVTNGSSPLAGVLVSTTGASTTTAPDGRYSLSVPNGTYNVTASKRPQYYDNTTTGVEVTPNNTTIRNFSLTLKPTGTISGQVKNASSGTGINGAVVKLMQYPEYNASTNSTGNYTINNVPVGTYTVSASAGGYATNTSSVIVNNGSTSTVNFMLTAAFKVYIPWTATTQGWTTPYVIANKGSSNASVNISYYNSADGSYAGNYSLVIVPDSSSFVFREWSAAGTDGSAVVVSDQPVTVVVEQMNNVENKFGPYEVDPSGSTEVFLPLTLTTGGWTTPYVVVNRGALNATVNITYYHTNGSAAGNYSLTILPGASNFVFREWTPSAAGTDGAARITSDQPISVLVDMFKNSQNKFGAYIPASVADTKVFLPWTATTQGWTTPFSIVNKGTVNAFVNISYYNAGLLAGNATVSITPNEVVTVSRENSTAIGTDGSAFIDSTQPVSVMVQQFNNVEGKFEAYTPAMNASTRIVIPWTATTQGWTTPYVIANRGSSNASVNISYYNSADGSYAGNYSLVIVPNSSSFVFREWSVAGTDGSALVVSDQPVTVVVDQLNNGQNKFGAYTPIG